MREPTSSPLVSVVVVAFNMERELPRTLATLSRRMQRGVKEIRYEVIVVDNGSHDPVSVPLDEDIHVIRIAEAPPSPAGAINTGIAAAKGEIIGVLIDGARMVSPGLIGHAAAASRVHQRAIVATLGFHLGPEVQMKSIAAGYDQIEEDALLAGSGWQEDGYRLFAISTVAGSSADGWFMPIAETNALFMRRVLWEELAGYDERFLSPGGGLVNLDSYKRACALPGSQLVMLLGEATFHQVHGGVATNASASPWAEFHREYVRIRGKPFERARVEPLYLGRVHPVVLPSVAEAARRATAAIT